ncbi:MAG: Asp-tRNA(Asn)/Glu-tRNA(Gln) amidotransferase subunit GatB [Acidobacteriota bacterium]|nr:Asp-tRNA(Asn)/Glu-tRNA(Gln) amidotransferase subunit GatB [Acidobacteriota bacterium]MDW3228889.1 Asp-tRNA(Asn)/Glu-tRNA(Gln) amidotransferase subunit GatB [Acidobacteriota bacterium]
MNYETVIGLEIHAQLLTRTKLFCRCSTEFGQTPNSLTCPVCLGLPGSLPVINREAVRMALKLALALEAKINLKSLFSRKNYFYPDLPKGYQITQYHLPIAESGQLAIEVEGQKMTIGIERINLEEDAGKSIHEGFSDSSEKTYLDFNRCGVPLLEIVGRPDLRSPAQAVEFVQNLRVLLQYLEICDGNMEEGNLRCDANLSIRPAGSPNLGTKTEVKNLNSFRFLAKALDYEANRQVELIERGGKIIQETRGWDSSANRTVPQRSKEEAHDYRYFPEPDLPPLVISESWKKEIAAELPELPRKKIERFIKDYQLPDYDARVLTTSRALADYFETTAKAAKNPKQASNWIMREVLQYIKETNLPIEEFPIPAESLAELIRLVEDRFITITIAKEKVFPEMLSEAGKVKKAVDPKAIIERLNLRPIADDKSLQNIIEQVLSENPGPVKQYLEGKVQVMGFLLGQVMKASQGKAAPQRARELLQEALNKVAEK